MPQSALKIPSSASWVALTPEMFVKKKFRAMKYGPTKRKTKKAYLLECNVSKNALGQIGPICIHKCAREGLIDSKIDKRSDCQLKRSLQTKNLLGESESRKGTKDFAVAMATAIGGWEDA